MHRRTLLRGLGTGLVAALAPAAGMRLAWGSPATRNGRALVVVFLRGGCDGLNMVVPYGEDAYHNARPTLRIAPPSPGDPASALDIDGFFGLHPALQPLHRHYQEGQVALLPTVHLPGGALSHFESQADMEYGGGGEGWLGRYLATTPVATAALALAPAPPLSLRGPRPVAAYADPFDLTLAANEAKDTLLQRVLEEAYPDGDIPGHRHAPWYEAATVLLADRNRARAPAPVAGAYPAGPFGVGLSGAAELLLTDPDLAVITLDLGGWDTHRHQGGDEGTQARRMAVLATGLDAFLAHLGPRRNDVAVLVQTEFGRTVEENASGGTDHGRAATWMVVGGGVRGGLYLNSGWPGLDPAYLEGGRYLAGTIDYRDVYGELLAAHLGATGLDAILPGHIVTPLGLL
ncbi:MAG: DUF1501 domain-containing protein [Gammaproteobacteria bacterium]|nr:DUF1501 domain-containing protein [Gammaproteobacteria bacterium]